MKNMKNRLSDIFTNAWVGNATAKGLAEAMDDLNYTWGSEARVPFAEAAPDVVKEDKNYPVKLAA